MHDALYHSNNDCEYQTSFFEQLKKDRSLVDMGQSKTSTQDNDELWQTRHLNFFISMASKARLADGA